MIYDSLKNISKYKGFNKKLDIVIDYINKNDIDKEVGTYTINKDIYFAVSEYVAKPVDVKLFEIHKDYIDVQLILRNKEDFKYKPYDSSLKKASNYDAASDIQFFEPKEEEYLKATLDNKTFVVFFENEYHMPGIKLNDNKVKKVVFKIKNK